MEKYKEQIICPKCGNDGFTTQYMHGNTTVLADGKRYSVYMQRNCCRCGYVVYQLPLDDKDEENKNV